MHFKKIKIPLIIIGLATAAISGWLMYDKWEAEKLWGYLPLWFFAGLWGALVLAFNTFWSKKEGALKVLGLSTLSGILLSLGFPPIPLTALMFVGFVPFLLAEQEISNSAEGKTTWRVFKYAYHTFVVWNIFTTYWVANTAFFAGIFAIWVNALFMSVPIVLFHLVKKRMPNLAWISFVGFWITFEYLHLHDELSWPWLTLGNSLSEFPSWVQFYEYTGVFGGTLWILATNVLFYKVVSNYYFHKAGITLSALIKPLALLILPILISLGVYYAYQEKGKEIEIVVAQPNFEPHYEKEYHDVFEQYKYHTVLAQKASTPETDYIIFPESSFSNLDEKNLSKNRLIRDLKNFLAPYPNGKLIMGVGSYRFFEEGEELPDAVRPYIQKTAQEEDTLYYEAYNAAFQLSNETQEVQMYHKSLLVPGAEFFPLKNLFPFMQPMVDKLGGSVYGLGKQKEREVFSSDDGTKMAPIICYESVYGEFVTGYVRKGANALVIMTNDGWWDNTAGHQQHLRFASLRAIETRRGIARAANTGISGFISQRGEILATTKYDEPVALRGIVKLNKKITFYVRYGDLIGRIALFLSILLILLFIATEWMRKAKGIKNEE
ncbi:MAG: apolipoprotein N-acyltransferase [Saprospiraceae bacterium]|jgi:apolipoprotein N-acyltransferase